MKITALTPTDRIVHMAGQTLQIWHGDTDDGRGVTLLIARVIVTDEQGSYRFVPATRETNVVGIRPAALKS